MNHKFAKIVRHTIRHINEGQLAEEVPVCDFLHIFHGIYVQNRRIEYVEYEIEILISYIVFLS